MHNCSQGHTNQHQEEHLHPIFQQPANNGIPTDFVSSDDSEHFTNDGNCVHEAGTTRLLVHRTHLSCDSAHHHHHAQPKARPTAP